MCQKICHKRGSGDDGSVDIVHALQALRFEFESSELMGVEGYLCNPRGHNNMGEGVEPEEFSETCGPG